MTPPQEPHGVRGLAGSRQPIVRNAADIAADLIRQAIVEGRFSPGEPLREERLAADLGISRTPIREALLIMQAEGLAEAVPKRGSVVRSYDVSEIADLYETRALLEGHAAARAARCRTEEELELLRESCRRFAGLMGPDEVVALVDENRTFHRIILEAARSRSLAHLVGVVTRLPLIYRSFYWYSPREKEIGLHYHERIVQALERQDSTRVEALMNEHILEALDVLQKHLIDPEARPAAAAD